MFWPVMASVHYVGPIRRAKNRICPRERNSTKRANLKKRSTATIIVHKSKVLDGKDQKRAEVH
jgi:hypothetical protein